MRHYYCLRCKSFAVTDPVEENCSRCKEELVNRMAVESKTLLTRLTPREYQVSELISAGATNQEIAEILGLALRSVENTINRLYRTLRITGQSNPRLQTALIFLSGGFDPRAFRAALDYCGAVLAEKEASARFEIAVGTMQDAREVLEGRVREDA